MYYVPKDLHVENGTLALNRDQFGHNHSYVRIKQFRENYSL